jgi:hypothetical protein
MSNIEQNPIWHNPRKWFPEITNRTMKRNNVRIGQKIHIGETQKPLRFDANIIIMPFSKGLN